MSVKRLPAQAEIRWLNRSAIVEHMFELAERHGVSANAVLLAPEMFVRHMVETGGKAFIEMSNGGCLQVIPRHSLRPQEMGVVRLKELVN